MKNSKVRFIAYSAMIAAAYVALTMISAAFGLSSGAIQVRISEALCVLPIFTLSAVPGVTVGCFIANILCGGTVYDIVFGHACHAYRRRHHLFYKKSAPIVHTDNRLKRSHRAHRAHHVWRRRSEYVPLFRAYRRTRRGYIVRYSRNDSCRIYGKSTEGFSGTF